MAAEEHNFCKVWTNLCVTNCSSPLKKKKFANIEICSSKYIKT